MTFAALCLAALALLAPAASLVVGLFLPVLDRLALHLPPRAAARFWLGVTLFPALLSVLLVGIALLPSFGLSPDHCLVHGDHHLHLCPYHLIEAPAAVLWILAALVPVRVAFAAFRSFSAARLAAWTARCLRDGAEYDGDAWIFAGRTPEAFVLGGLNPQIFVSRGLIDIGGDVYQAALAHERDHVLHRDAAFRMGMSLLLAGHLPGVSAALHRRLAACQELAADHAAGASKLGRLAVAEALLRVARVRAHAPQPQIGFAHGDVTHRVLTLLEPAPAPSPRPLVLAACMWVLLVGMSAASHHEIHHGIESLLGLFDHS